MGMMVPLPVQRAMSIALSDEKHVIAQGELYRNRRSRLSLALIENGFKIENSESGLYIWCTRGEEDWQSVAWFAERGIIVTPGNFYGQAGNRHIRIALTATDAKIDEAAARIGKAL
jgi:aspartate/methionine/tyrosine aminotransferase